MSILENLWWYLVLIGVMILIHELGHYWAARWFDVKVETFSFGFGPRLFGFQRGETDFRFSAILFGGYVKMLGEQPGDEHGSDPRALTSKPRWQRVIIAFAGPAINIVLAVALLTGLFMVHYEKRPNPHSPVVGYLENDGPAAKANIRIGDKIVQVEDTVDPDWQDVTNLALMSAGRPMQVWVDRAGDRVRIPVTPIVEGRQGLDPLGWAPESEIEIAAVSKGQEGEQAGLQRGDILVSVNGMPLLSSARLNEIEKTTQGAPLDLVYSRKGVRQHVNVKPAWRSPIPGEPERWMIGLTLAPRVDVVQLPFPQAVSEATRASAVNAQLIVKYLQGLVQRRMSAKMIEGPLRIAKLSGDAAREGPLTYIGLMAAVSLNLAIFNLIPIPILDGGVILVLLIEMLMRRDLDLRVKETVIKVGFVFLMFVVVFVLYNDITKIFPGKS